MIPKLEHLIQQYTTTTVKRGDKELKGYLAYLNADYASAVAMVTKTLGEYNSKYSDWKTATGLAVGVGVSIGWIPIFGWIPLGFVAHNADNLHEAWDKLWHEYNALKQDSEEEARLIDFATKMVAQSNGIDKKIQAAIDTVGTLKQTFQKQAESYESIRSTVNFITTGAVDPDAGNRKAFIETLLTISIGKLKELNTASIGFIDAISDEKENPFKKS